MVERKNYETEALPRAGQRERQNVAFRRTERLPSRRPAYAVASTAHGIPERSRTTALVFQAILGAAACLALVGVVAATQNATTTGVNPTSPDAPPPAVFVHLD